jgi:hypothetical protein
MKVKKNKNTIARHSEFIDKIDDKDLKYFQFANMPFLKEEYLIVLDMFLFKTVGIVTDEDIEGVLRLFNSEDKSNSIVATEIYKIKRKEFKKLKSIPEDLYLNYKDLVYKPFQKFLNQKYLDGVLDKIGI